MVHLTVRLSSGCRPLAGGGRHIVADKRLDGGFIGGKRGETFSLSSSVLVQAIRSEAVNLLPDPVGKPNFIGETGEVILLIRLASFHPKPVCRFVLEFAQPLPI